MNKFRMKKLYLILLSTVGIILFYSGCEKNLDEQSFLTSEGVLMGECFKAHPDTFGEFYKILEKTQSVSFLNSYVVYTCFAPNNEAVQSFYEGNGKTSIDGFTSDDDLLKLRHLVRYHICPDSITSR